MLKSPLLAATILGILATSRGTMAAPPKYNDIQTLVVIYAENRSFDNLYGTFPGANGLARASRQSIVQLDRDGKLLPGLPAVWGATANKVTEGAPVAPVGLTQEQTATFLKRINRPYDVAALYRAGGPSDVNPL